MTSATKAPKHADFAARLNELMEKPDSPIKTVSDLKETAGVTYEMARRYILGTAKPRDEKLEKIAIKFDVSTGYLDHGERDAIKPTDIRGLPKKSDGTPLNQVQEVPPEEMVLVPYYEDLAGSCGNGRLAEAFEKTHTTTKIRRSILNECHVNQSNVKAFPSEGSSMVPMIYDKSKVFVDMSKKKVIDGKIYAVCHGGLFKFKQLYNEPLEGIRIVSTNADEFPEEKLTKEQKKAQEFEIIGYAFYVENRLP